ncbi:hypothetical protein HAZT_HAZT010015 [Hyalella azteca]|uniref:BLOC-1-related complex subunit 7 n=1 Tax=Hyalella azteca TaxID=294128 RepID=A0A6A0H3E8_HYAAZ|nr:hypothetical protein HAZT_HAZT010015 [Hyalella azteca]
MASASSTSAKNLFVDSKRRLGERVHVNVNNLASICRQVLRGSQSADLLVKAARNMALQDATLDSTWDNAQKLGVLVTHLTYQQEAIERSVSALPEIKEQVRF